MARDKGVQKPKSKKHRTDELDLIGDETNTNCNIKKDKKKKSKTQDTRRAKKQRQQSVWEQIQIVGRKILSLDFTCDGLMPLNFAELERIIIYTILLVFSAYNGINIPSRLDSSFNNISAKTGFSTGHSTFRVHFSGFTTYSQRVFVYGQFFRHYLPDIPDEIIAMSTDTSINVTISERFTQRDAVESFSVFKFDSDVDTYGQKSDIVPLVQLYDPHFSECNLTIDVNGNIAMYDTLQISEYSQNSQFTKTQFWYRFVFVVASLCLIAWHYANGERDGRLKLAIVIAVATILCYGPTGIVLFFEQKQFVFVLDMILGDLYSLFVYSVWIIVILRNCHVPASMKGIVRYVLTFGGLIVGGITIADSYSRASSEYRDINSWATAPMSGLDFTVLFMHGFLIFVSYMLFIMRRKMTGDGLGSRAEVFQNWVDLPTYTFFVSQFCHLFDEVLVRMKLINVMCVAKQLRQFAEVSCIFLMTINQKEDVEYVMESESDNPLSDVKCEIVPDIDFTKPEEE